MPDKQLMEEMNHLKDLMEGKEKVEHTHTHTFIHTYTSYPHHPEEEHSASEIRYS